MRGERRQTAVRHKAHNDDEGTKRAAGQESGGTAGPGRRNRMETMHVMCTKGVGASGAEGGQNGIVEEDGYLMVSVCLSVVSNWFEISLRDTATADGRRGGRSNQRSGRKGRVNAADVYGSLPPQTFPSHSRQGVE